MLLLSDSIINKPILSLRTGGQIAQVFGFIVNPNDLKIEGFYCHDRLNKTNLVLLYQDIRNMMPQGIVVNDHDVLSQPDILVRLQEIIKINFMIIGKPVVTASKHKVGKVKDFAIDSESFFIKKLYVGQSLIKSINTGQLSIDRTQIVEVTDTNIIIQDLLNTNEVTATNTTTSFSSST